MSNFFDTTHDAHLPPEILTEKISVEVYPDVTTHTAAPTPERVCQDFKNGAHLRWVYDRSRAVLKVWSLRVTMADHDRVDQAAYDNGFYGDVDKKNGFQYYERGLLENEKKAIEMKLTQFLKGV
ncbi:MAG: hypothetical protein A2538_01285 [Candidatus Magasanikbacteria bacterium RIFOXYD2_FULL_41_14]|uniref:Uncharacterized protein n=1 Tax=Candidatus Magasanikbacteria bacterium RIFOXYD2_FULL_41_14 TaxID=1798709 RepID=A0A1F6PCF5_9BACT|nr:MAG: hypothetical protein A2538_01285 [Candidatus Magasanikbacteria bacterium RIFOXYD2_FULL_41_14]